MESLQDFDTHHHPGPGYDILDTPVPGKYTY